MVQRKCTTVSAAGCKFYSQSFSLSYGNEAQCDVKFRHSTHNASRIRRKVGNENVLMGTECCTRFPLPTQLFVGYSLKLKKKTSCKMYIVTADLLFNSEQQQYERDNTLSYG